ncbi:dehydratase [Paraburkholderia ginsengiterrae]|uniref:Dehydratase n=1 Tax=Paraburkholderia ginsengiterrae TaxID=1462993 RepID=A0A1A9N916_9BURK|nr:MaoC family dehydratase [Paraburkholderia ginsengiterrae]OAJ51633.1 dehydratase [Paraburkholderia ginsengiterrae]OAJ61820.1 dehydratase [Paraburkholderia ginsengiterrae]
MNSFENISDLQPLVGQSIGTSDWLVVDQARVNQFADATGDHQWIHVDMERAKAGPFGGPIAHGFLTLSLLPGFFATAFHIRHCRRGVNYGLDKVRFMTPVPVGKRVRAHFQLLAWDALEGGAQMKIEMTVELENAAKPACVAESIIRQYS